MKIKSFLKTMGYIVGVIILIYFLEWWGIVGLLIFFVAIYAKKAWDMRESFKLATKSLETTIWGKPLDKDIWEKGEMKHHKVKVTWGKKKHGKKKTDK